MDDLLVAVYETKSVSVFYRGADGSLPSYPSYNISLTRSPLRISVADVFGTGDEQIIILEEKLNILDSDYIAIYNRTTDYSFDRIINRTPPTNAVDFAISDLNGDTYPDIAIACQGSNPTTNPGRIEIRLGPFYSDYVTFLSGNGTNSVVVGDFNTDGSPDIAVANYYDCNVRIYYAPFFDAMSSDLILSVDENPSDLASGRLDSDSKVDLVVSTINPSPINPSTLKIFLQGSSQLSVSENYLISLDDDPSAILIADLNYDSKDDILLLSMEESIALGYFQGDTSPIWDSINDFIIPVSRGPRNACFVDYSQDIAIAGKGYDSSGSSIAIYSTKSFTYSNGNATIWTDVNYEAASLATGDINGDDHEDIVLAYPALNEICYYLSAGGPPNVWPLTYSADEIAIEDLNDDGFDDTITSNRSHDYVRVLFGQTSSPDFFTVVQLDCESNVTDIAIGDMNNDGFPDVIASTLNGSLCIFMSTGAGANFEEARILCPTPGESIASIVVGDFDSDGLDDIAYPRADRAIDILLQPEADSEFSLPADRTLTMDTDPDLTCLWSGDITGDGRDDLVAMRPSDPKMYLFRQDDFITAPHPFTTLDLPEVPSFVSVTDVTDDGHADVLAIFDSADLVFLYKQSGSSLPSSPSMVFVTGAYPVWAGLGDGNDDHRGDLLVVDSVSHSISVWVQNNFAPTVYAGGPYTTEQGDWHQFNGSCTTGSSELPYMEYRWEFGDGSELDWSRDSAPLHRYMSLGNFTVNVSARDPWGLTDSDSTYIHVTDSVPDVEFTWSPLNPVEGQMVVFEDATESYDEVVLLNWSVDGALFSTGLEHTISTSFDDGIHTVQLTALDSDGSDASVSHTFAVQAADPEMQIIALGIADEGDPVTFTVIIDSWYGGPIDPIASYEWNFSYTGEPFEASETTGTSNTTNHVFGASGISQTYVVAVKVTDIDGDYNISYINIEILDIGPTASFRFSNADPEEGIPFTTIDETYTYDGISTWSWTLTYPDSTYQTWSLNASDMGYIEFVLGNGSYSMQLQVAETDGDSDTFVLDFEVAEIPPLVTLIARPLSSSYLEFQMITLSAQVQSHDEITGFQWDFVSLGAQFIKDASTDSNETTYSYSWIGNYTAKVNVTDADGSYVIAETDIEVIDAGLSASFESDVDVLREDLNRTNELTFDASAIATRFPDISLTTWEFGDGSKEILPGPPSEAITHEYDPIHDYVVNLTLSDDDGNTLIVSKTLLLIQPSIELINPIDDNVIRSGSPIRFILDDDSLPLVSVQYSVDSQPYMDFATLYSIDTSDWTDGAYSLSVRAEDKDGNIAVKDDIEIRIDDTSPTVEVLWSGISAYGGDKVNISIQVTDDNIDPDSVVLFIKYPGDDSASSLLMRQGTDGRFYALVEMPKRAGTVEFYVHVADLAGNEITTESNYFDVKLHFIDAAWPYLLVAAMIAMVGTGVYFLRESKIAVDETFVIYNDGRMLAHSTRRLKPGMDDQVLSSMFVAIQDFIKDSFKDETSFTLRKLDFGDKSVLIEKGDHLFLAVVLHGKASKKVAKKMKDVLDSIEDEFSTTLVDWDGDFDQVRGVTDMVSRLYSKAPTLPSILLPSLLNRKKET